MSHVVDRVGETFGLLTVTARAGSDRWGGALWQCSCACGKKSVLRSSDLKKGHTKSCGCLKVKHGQAVGRTVEYRAWISMRMRCLNPAVRMYPVYGGRGIKICGRWDLFENFYADMGPRPEGNFEIDRINPDGDYEPGNCRWIPRNSGIRRCELVSYRGKTMALKEAVVAAGSIIRPQTARERVNKLGWSVERAVETPARS